MRRGLLPLFALLAALHGAAHALTPGEPLRIGFVCPFSGGSQDFGNAARLGAELAVREINEVGGYLGTPLELVTRDDKANPDEGRKIAEELVLQKKVAFTLGYCNTGVAMKALDVYQDHQHLLLVPVATGTAITAKYPAASSTIFRLSVRDELQVPFMVDDIVRRRGLNRVAVFADKTGYGEGGLQDVVKALAEKQLAPVYVARFDLGVASLVQQMQEAKAAGANAIISYTVGPEQAVAAKARAEARVAAPLYGPWTMSFRTVYERAGAATEGVLMPQTIIQDIAHERRTSFQLRLRKLAGAGSPIGSLMAAAQSYDAVHLMLWAVFQTKGDTRGPALKHALENLERPYTGVVTTYDKPFSAGDHDAATRNMLWLGTWRGGEIQFAYPEDAKRAATIQRKAAP